jgi:uncharacterized membrane-anchored protein
MRTKLILIAILVQFGVLAWMAGEREWIVRTGPPIWLRTAPVDPRDLFRGDYVRLNYDIATVADHQIGPGLEKYLANARQKGASRHWLGKEIVVYSALRIHSDRDVAEITTTDLTPPSSGLFIKGRVKPYGGAVHGVRYGIESYFVQQGKGRKLERRAPEGLPSGVQVPMDMEVALGGNGTAVLKGYRWNALGIGVDLRAKEAPGPMSPGTAPAIPRKPNAKIMRVSLTNASSAPLAVVLPPDLRTLRFERLADWTGTGVDTGVPRTDLPPLTDADVRLLQPRETVTVEIDPANPEWFVKPRPDAPAQPLSEIANLGFGLRIRYEAPSATACQGLRQAAPIWHAPVSSRTISSYELTHP